MRLFLEILFDFCKYSLCIDFQALLIGALSRFLESLNVIFNGPLEFLRVNRLATRAQIGEFEILFGHGITRSGPCEEVVCTGGSHFAPRRKDCIQFSENGLHQEIRSHQTFEILVFDFFFFRHNT